MRRAVLFGAVTLGVALGVPETTPFQYKWIEPDVGFSCQSRSGQDIAVPIGEDGNDFDIDVTVSFCKIQCAKDTRCQGFDYQDVPGPQPSICRYRGQIDKDTLVREYESTTYTSCYIYERPGVVALTTTTVVPPTTTTTNTGLIFPFEWTAAKGFDCKATVVSFLAIGERVTEDGVRTSYDRWPVDTCKEKCAQNEDCKGFNYDHNSGICRYHKTLSQADTVANPVDDCWIYNRPEKKTTTTPKKHKKTTTWTTTSSSEGIAGWLQEGFGLLGQIWQNNDAPVVVHGRSLRGAHSDS